ncbi:MAG: hypothetical protein JST93_21045 [Acidobacteria bacterium]|nr:hypothetical protein [Acidobacteriota bacterium]
MKQTLGILLAAAAFAQQPYKPALRPGVSVQMPIAAHAVEMRAADEPDSIVVAITAEGKVYNGITVAEPETLSAITTGTVFVKADSRAPFQRVLAVLDALKGKSVVLLSAPPAQSAKGASTPPYGIRLTVSR